MHLHFNIESLSNIMMNSSRLRTEPWCTSTLTLKVFLSPIHPHCCILIHCLYHLSLISLSGSLNQWFHLFILYSFLWCTPRFRTWPTPFYSLYNSSRLGDLKKFPQIPFVRWWHPAVHLFHSYKFCSMSWNTYHHFHWHSFLDELEQIAPQSI